MKGDLFYLSYKDSIYLNKWNDLFYIFNKDNIFLN